MEEEISFADLGLNDKVLAAIEKKGFKTPSPIQTLAIPRLLSGDANLIAKARTGTGKTAAFGLPIVQNVNEESDHVRALILEPTRELAIQTCTELQSFTTDKYPRVTVLYGGASYSTQLKDLRRGCEIVVGTPGRIQDHLERGSLQIDKIDYFILDEGDEMLDMGFVDDIENIFDQANPNARILLFSATMPAPILKIAQKFMGEYEVVEEEGFVEEALLIDQKYWVVRESEKIEALVRLIDISPDFYGIVFTQTKFDADNVTKMLDERGYEAAALHGDIPQGQREKIIARFRSKKTRVLVATDVAARGIDISGLSHVVNYSLPFDAATYVHRIGRTGRAGTSGMAVTFVTPNERRKLDFMINRVRKASKGDLTEGKIPGIKEVLSVKRNRMLEELKIQLGLAKNPEDEEVVSQKEEKETSPEVDDEIIPIEGSEDGENPAEPGETGDTSEENQTNETPEFIPNLKTAKEVYVKMAESLCQTFDAKEVLASVLEVVYGSKLDESRYGEVSSQGGGARKDQKRIYVQLGRRDGYNARGIAEYFSDLLHIPGRLVDRIDVSENFSLVSLPIANADAVLRMAEEGRGGIPHMHVDSKEAGGFGGRGGRDRGRRGGFGGGRGFGRDRDGEGRGFGRRDRDRDFGGRRSGFRNEHGRARPHTATERSGASAYKKSSRKSNEF